MSVKHTNQLVDARSTWELDDPIHPLTADVESSLVVTIVVVIIIAVV